ncbi:MAG: U32 family peptidase [Clostridia bacterium]|nr:U32 family peptidase [Clostridia bacterium]
MELLAPVGNPDKLKLAIHYGADAVYLASKRFGLRTFAGNFDEEQLKWAVEYVHNAGKKIYVTINILPHDSDFDGLDDYIKSLDALGVDAIIVADLGVLRVAKRVAPKLDIHISTQANVLNSETANFYADLGVKRIILARELSLEEIKNIRDNLPRDIELECFGHGAMCISYSGRCLLSTFMTGRDANRGACVQACRWNYTIRETNKKDEYPIEEDSKGTYILNSHDMCMIEHLDKLRDAGIASIKVEGRMKSEYYVANIINAYRQALDYMDSHKTYDLPSEIANEVNKSSHRTYSTGFFFGDAKQNLETSMPEADYNFIAIVLEDTKDGKALVEMRNRFEVNSTLEVLSKFNNNAIIHINKIEDDQGNLIEDVKVVQQRVYVYTDQPLHKYDILRNKKLVVRLLEEIDKM